MPDSDGIGDAGRGAFNAFEVAAVWVVATRVLSVVKSPLRDGRQANGILER